MEGKQVRAIIRYEAQLKKLGKEKTTEIKGRYLGIEYYGSEGIDGSVATDTCLLVVDNETGKVLECGLDDITFLE